MEVVATVADLRARVAEARRGSRRIGLVPTMGAFHEGHLSLMRRAHAECGYVVVTLFVNPTQFGPSEDLSRYPRDLEGDRRMAEGTGADLLFAPPNDEVYPRGSATTVEVAGPLTSGLEGASRPTHFLGVATVVAKLFNISQPDVAYFGEKDYQQLQVIRRLTRDLDFDIEIVPCPIVRDPDGLAMSSRNRYLSAEERQAARSLSRGLRSAAALFEGGERSARRLTAVVRSELEAEPLVHTDYVELAAGPDLDPVQHSADGESVLLVAARVGNTRLIDNVVLRS